MPNTITIAMVCSARTVHRSCVATHTRLLMEQNKLPHGRSQLGVTSIVPNTITIAMVCSVQTMHQSCAETNTSLDGAEQAST